MRSLRDIPVKQKLILIIFVVSGTALLLASGAAFLHNVFILRHSLAHEVTALANIVAVNAAAPLAFRDGEAAREVLTALGAEPRVLLACIHDKEGRVLAAYLRDRRRDDVHAAREPRHQHAAAGRSLLESRPVILDGEEIGTVYIRYDLSALDTLLARSALVTAAVLVVATCAAVALSWFLQRLISVPILQLTDVAKLITRHGDYSVRAEKHGDDEIGVLIDGFNAMLNQIQTRDAELQHHQERLEEQVERRTEELRQANEELKREISERESAQNRRRELEAQLRQKQKLASVGTL
ncbi:MAG: HAMP domain-containing protein, partial [Lentisphaerae bacterium]|nr:HAMP domain-containing protein [Lentisphaerota bacterium]